MTGRRIFRTVEYMTSGPAAEVPGATPAQEGGGLKPAPEAKSGKAFKKKPAIDAPSDAPSTASPIVQQEQPAASAGDAAVTDANLTSPVASDAQTETKKGKKDKPKTPKKGKSDTEASQPLPVEFNIQDVPQTEPPTLAQETTPAFQENKYALGDADIPLDLEQPLPISAPIQVESTTPPKNEILRAAATGEPIPPGYDAQTWEQVVHNIGKIRADDLKNAEINFAGQSNRDAVLAMAKAKGIDGLTHDELQAAVEYANSQQAYTEILGQLGAEMPDTENRDEFAREIMSAMQKGQNSKGETWTSWENNSSTQRWIQGAAQYRDWQREDLQNEQPQEGKPKSKVVAPPEPPVLPPAEPPKPPEPPKVAAESAPVIEITPQTIELEAAPLEYRNDILSLSDQYMFNTQIVLGGEIQLPDGSSVKIRGVLGKLREDAEKILGNLAGAPDRLRNEKRLHGDRVEAFGKVLLETTAVRNAQEVLQQKEREGLRQTQLADQRVKAREGQVQAFLTANNLNGERVSLDALLRLEEYMTANPTLETDKFSPEMVQAVQAIRQEKSRGKPLPSRASLQSHIFGTDFDLGKSSDEKYLEYKRLVQGGEGGVSLSTLQSNKDKVKAEWENAIKESRENVERMKQKAKEYKEIEKSLKGGLTPEQQAANDVYTSVRAVEDHLALYLPDESRMYVMEGEIKPANADAINDGISLNNMIFEINDMELPVELKNKLQRNLDEAQAALGARAHRLTQEFNAYIDPLARLTRAGCPPQLARAISIVQEAKFNPDLKTLAPETVPYVESAMILLGHGKVKVERAGSPTPITPPRPDEPTQPEPEQPKPTTTESVSISTMSPAKLNELSTDVLVSLGRELTQTQVNSLPIEKRLLLSASNVLDLEGLTNLPRDDDAESRANQLLELNDDLRSSEIAENTKLAESNPKLRAELMGEAEQLLASTATVLTQEPGMGDRVLSVAEMRAIMESNPTKYRDALLTLNTAVSLLQGLGVYPQVVTKE